MHNGALLSNIKHRNSEPASHFSIHKVFSAVSDPVISSSAGLLVTAVFSAAPCVQSWQMCSGTEKTRPNPERWSETFLYGLQTTCSLLCPSLLPVDNQTPHPAQTWLHASFFCPSLSFTTCFHGLSITARLDRDALAGLWWRLISQDRLRSVKVSSRPSLQHYRVLSLFSIWSAQAGGQEHERTEHKRISETQ